MSNTINNTFEFLALTTNDIEQVNANLRTLSDEDLRRHTRNLVDTKEYYSRPSMRDVEQAVRVRELLHLAETEQCRRYGHVVEALGTVRVHTNFRSVTLIAAIWTRYASGPYADGNNGCLKGTNEATGKLETFDWAHKRKSYVNWSDQVLTFDLATCG